MEYFYYIIMGDTPAGYPRAAAPFKSTLCWFEFKEYIDERCEQLHESGKDRVFRLGAVEFVNPKIMCAEDFKNYCPYIIEV